MFIPSDSKVTFWFDNVWKVFQKTYSTHRFDDTCFDSPSPRFYVSLGVFSTILDGDTLQLTNVESLVGGYYSGDLTRVFVNVSRHVYVCHATQKREVNVTYDNYCKSLRFLLL